MNKFNETRSQLSSRLTRREVSPNIEYIPTIPKAIEFLRDQINHEDLVISMGAGDVWKVAEGLKK